MKKPNFFLIGAPKCGTTSLSKYLSQHPHIFFSRPKGTNYFSTDIKLLYDSQSPHSLDEFTALYSSAHEAFQAVGEGSVLNLFSQVAVKKILDFNPDAKFIIMIRNPVEGAYSFHAQSVRSGYENIFDFRKAWNAQNERKQEKRVPLCCPDKKLLLYGEIYQYGDQLERLFSYVPREKVLVVLFDDFISNTKREYEKVLNFLNVPSDNREQFEVWNKNKRVKIFILYKLVVFLKCFSAFCRQKLKIKIRTGLLSKINSTCFVVDGREKFSKEFEREIKNYFREDIKKLSRLLDCDFTHWTR